MGSTAETTKTDSPGGLVPNRHFLRPADFSRATLAKSGIPVTREGHRVQASPEQLNRWMERETSEPVHIATESADLSSELLRGLFYVKKQKAQRKKESRINSFARRAKQDQAEQEPGPKPGRARLQSCRNRRALDTALAAEGVSPYLTD